MLKILATTETNYGLTTEAILSTVLYTILGVMIMVISIAFINMVFKFNLRHELTKDHNVSYGVAIAGFAIAIGIIIAGTIAS